MSYKQNINSNINFYRTAESVSPMHPDKICDRIADAILDAYLAKDPDARVAIEVCGGHGQICVMGEITSSAKNIGIKKIVQRIAGEQLEVQTNIVKQSPEIARGVDDGGAGDQGIVTGYACDETPELLPQEVVWARQLNQFIFAQYPYDGKTQFTLSSEGKVTDIVASFQNLPSEFLAQLVQQFIMQNRIPGAIFLHINPAGDWFQGGFDADTGLTGRKLVVDNYGPRIPIGGGSFSGKDPSKVDRSAAYMARRIAVDYLKKRHAHEVYVRLAYVIGMTEPVEQTVIVDGQAEKITGYDLTPQGIIKFLDLKRPIYEQTAHYGHFGNGFDWDRN